jgi:hypothetical protein
MTVPLAVNGSARKCTFQQNHGMKAQDWAGAVVL